MSFASAKVEVEQYVEANFTATPIEFENASIDFEGLSEWVRVGFQSSGAKRITIGIESYRYYGLLIFQIFTKPDVGAGRSAVIADLLSTLFRSKVLGTFHFQVPEAVSVGESDGWYQTNLIIPNYRQE